MGWSFLRPNEVFNSRIQRKKSRGEENVTVGQMGLSEVLQVSAITGERQEN